MKREWTMGELFEDIAERVATARTRALMGERKEALALLQKAKMDYMRFQEVLRDYPGSLALQRSIETAQTALCEERARERETQPKRTKSKKTNRSSRAA